MCLHIMCAYLIYKYVCLQMCNAIISSFWISSFLISKYKQVCYQFHIIFVIPLPHSLYFLKFMWRCLFSPLNFHCFHACYSLFLYFTIFFLYKRVVHNEHIWFAEFGHKCTRMKASAQSVSETSFITSKSFLPTSLLLLLTLS